MWRQHSVILINHYGLSLADPKRKPFSKQQMEEFVFGEDAAMPKVSAAGCAEVKGWPEVA